MFLSQSGLAVSTSAGPPLHQQTYDAWTHLGDAERAPREWDLRCVHDLSRPQARPLMTEAAKSVWTGTDAVLLEQSRCWTVEDLAMRLYLANPSAFRHCYRAFQIDVTDSYREYQGTRVVEPRLCAENRVRMMVEMGEACRKRNGSHRCVVEDFANSEKISFFIYHQDEMKAHEQITTEGKLEPDWYRPIVRIAMTYRLKDARLLVKAPRQPLRVKLQRLFGEIVLGDPDFFEEVAQMNCFSFAPLQDRNFCFPTRPSDPIERVWVAHVAATPLRRDADIVDVTLKPNLTMDRVQDTLAAFGIDPERDNVHWVTLGARFRGFGRSNSQQIHLKNPNFCSLGDTERDRMVREYFNYWGFDAAARRLRMELSR